jgi:rare lipoprotein A (peptidoglycan hydrolase)
VLLSKSVTKAPRTQKRDSLKLFLVFLSFVHAGAVRVRLSERIRTFTFLLLAMIAASACSHNASRVRAPAPARIGKTETGLASWYGPGYNGKRTASGEVFDMDQLTAAHKKLPFQTWVEVTNLRTGQKVNVRITDRGPFVHRRIVDLSRGAAREIDLERAGVEKVRLRVIRPPSQSGGQK